MAVRVIQIPSERMDSNSYLVEKDGHVIIIDGSGYEGIRDAIRAHGWQVDYLLLTHEHFDHIWFLEKLREEYRMPVIACRLCSERIQDVKANLSNISDLLYYFKTGIVREGKSRSFTCRAADVVYEDEWQLLWRGCRLEFRRLPGHSPASAIITLGKAPEPANVPSAAPAETPADPAETPAAPADPAETPAAPAMTGGEEDADRIWAFTGDYLIRGEEEVLRLKDGSPEDYELFARPVLEGICEGTMICPGHGPMYVKGREDAKRDVR